MLVLISSVTTVTVIFALIAAKAQFPDDDAGNHLTSSQEMCDSDGASWNAVGFVCTTFVFCFGTIVALAIHFFWHMKKRQFVEDEGPISNKAEEKGKSRSEIICDVLNAMGLACFGSMKRHLFGLTAAFLAIGYHFVLSLQFFGAFSCETMGSWTLGAYTYVSLTWTLMVVIPNISMVGLPIIL